MQTSKSTTGIRLAAFYFIGLASMGLYGPYWGLYLTSLHYSPFQIGIILALPPLANLIAPGISGSIADKRGRRVDMLRWLSIAAALLFSASLINTTFLWQLTSLFVFFLAFTAMTPLIEATTLNHLKGEAHQYGKIRVWGTIGYIILAVIGGYVTEHFGIAILPPLLLCLFGCVALVSFTLPADQARPRAAVQGGFFAATKKKNPLLLYTSCFFIVLAHGIYNGFYSIHLMEQGYNKIVIGAMWTSATISEALFFAFSSSLMVKFSLKKMYILSFVVASLRFVLIGWYADKLGLLVLLQVFHGLTFSMHHAASMVYLEKLYPATLLSRAQALYSAFPYGIGAALGGIMAGAVWTWLGAGWVFTLAGGCAFIGLLISLNLSTAASMTQQK
jgi:PPP family 3-phenylpropionic acid transporter